jgi:hypothetical protein
MKTFSFAATLFTMSVASGLGAQTLFTTEDYRQDREHWTDPAYYEDNTARELTDMQVNNRYGERGSGADNYTLTSPYPYRSSEEHYQAWLEQADGGTKHSFETLPNWDGLWGGGSSWLISVGVQASSVASVLTPQYQEYYVQQVKAESEGRHWWAASFCLPNGFVRGVWRSPKEFVLRPDKVWTISSILVETQVRWIRTDGSGHSSEDMSYPKWLGESIGFWDDGALIIHTNQIKSWNATHSMFEWSDQMTAVERYELVDDTIVGEVTLYDSNAFIAPLHAKFQFNRIDLPGFRMNYDTCTDTNGPSSKIFLDDAGRIDEHVPGDPGYWDSTDARPWAKHYAQGE